MMDRRDALERGATGLAALAASSAGLALIARRAFGQDLPSGAADVLNYALTLEYLESAFYRKGLATAGLIPDRDREIFQTISDHEDQHVAFLKQALGRKAAPSPAFDFTAGGTFDTFEDYETFRLLSLAFEDTGVRAYKGQAIVQAAKPLLDAPKLLTAALTIHSVEARHAARVRQLLGFEPWIAADFPDAPGPVKPVYATDPDLAQREPSFAVGSKTVFGVDLTAAQGVDQGAITAAFDEPLGMSAVLNIAAMFIG